MSQKGQYGKRRQVLNKEGFPKIIESPQRSRRSRAHSRLASDGPKSINLYSRSHRTAPPTLQSGHPATLLSTCEHHPHCQKPVNINISFDIGVCVLTCSRRLTSTDASRTHWECLTCAHAHCATGASRYLRVHVPPPSFHPSVITPSRRNALHRLRFLACVPRPDRDAREIPRHTRTTRRCFP